MNADGNSKFNITKLRAWTLTFLKTTGNSKR